MSDVEEAERLSRRRASMLIAMTSLFAVQQIAFYSEPPGDRVVDYVRIGSWVLLVGVLLAALLTGGFWLRSRAIRALIDDEVTVANRAKAVSLAFGASMTMAIALFVFAPPLALTAREVIHLIVSTGLVVGIFRFGQLERRVHNLG
jgi:hypothetical protein